MQKAAHMQKVSGIGGFFFRARDVSVLSKWYADHLGVTDLEGGCDQPVWPQAAGPTVFAPFKQDSDYFGNPDKQWMLNFRVDDLDAMISQLEGAGITVRRGPEEVYGRFAWLNDPEGNPIELWEPADPTSA